MGFGKAGLLSGKAGLNLLIPPPCVAGIFIAALVLSVVPRVTLEAPAATPLFEDRHGAFLSEGSNQYDRLGFWDIPIPIPERIRQCILTVEDRRFYRHVGVDLKALMRVIYRNLFAGEHQGGSTIAMQVARMQTPSRRSLWNKLVETVTAVMLTQRFSREAVLAHYMKIVPQGNQVYGFAYAARRYFRKPIEDLSWAEAALLASLPRAPDTYNLFRFDGFLKAISRARMILGLLDREKIIDPETYKQAMKELNRMRTPVRETRPEHSYHFIFRLLDNYKPLQAGSYTRPIRTTLDTNIQEYLESLARYAMLRYRPYGAGNIAMMVVDRKTGEILGYIGSESYFDENYGGSINYAHTPRSSGSTLKPFLYALGLERGLYTPASILADLPLHIVNTSGEFSFSYSNFDEAVLGPMLYRRALANSRNIPTVRVLETVGIKETYDFFRQLGLHDGRLPPGHYGYGLALGGLFVTLEDLIRCYGILANEGKDFYLKWLFSRDPSEEPLQTQGPADQGQTPDEGKTGDPILLEATARQLSLFLSDPLARLPSFPRLSTLEVPFPVAIKTGTSFGFRDAWSMAYSSRYIVGVWIGHPENARMNHVGSLQSSGLVQSIFRYLQPEESRGINQEPFPPPRDNVPVRLCPLSGQRASEHCPMVTLEYLQPGTEPQTLCQVHRPFAVDRETGTLADALTPPGRIVTQTYTVLPPEYATWGAKRGYGEPPVRSYYRPEASVRIVEPPNGSRYLIDPEIPRVFQTLALRADVSPSVPEIVWYVDGEEYRRVAYPYETRWSLSSGEHTFQARFSRSSVASDLVSIRIAD